MSDIFIISQHRTGSTLLKNMLDANPSVCMAFDEMNLFEPMRKNTLDKVIESGVQTVDHLIDAISRREIYGTFWQEFDKSGIDKMALKVALTDEAKLTPHFVLKATLRLLCEHNGAKHSGIKYPVHFSKVAWLKESFPQSRMIFLTRNPKAIVASKLNDVATRVRKSKSPFHHFAIHYFTLVYFCMEFRRSAKVFQNNKSYLYKVLYEDLVTNQSATLENLCQYLGFDFAPQMLEVTGTGSSFSETPIAELTAVSVHKYKTVLSTFDQWVIGLLTQKSYKVFLESK